MLQSPLWSKNLQRSGVPSSSGFSSFFLLSEIMLNVVITLPNASCSCQLEIVVSFLTTLAFESYPTFFAILPMSSFVNGRLPCRSQQLWQSGQRHFHNTYRRSFDKVGIWKMTPPTFTGVSTTSLYLPVWKSYNFGSIFHFLARRSSASLTRLLSYCCTV